MDLNTTRRLNNGVEMPMMGLGVFRSPGWTGDRGRRPLGLGSRVPAH